MNKCFRFLFFYQFNFYNWSCLACMINIYSYILHFIIIKSPLYAIIFLNISLFLLERFFTFRKIHICFVLSLLKFTIKLYLSLRETLNKTSSHKNKLFSRICPETREEMREQGDQIGLRLAFACEAVSVALLRRHEVSEMLISFKMRPKFMHLLSFKLHACRLSDCRQNLKLTFYS